MADAAPAVTEHEPPAAGRSFLGVGRNVLLLGVVSLLTDVSSDMIIPLLPLFVTQVLRADLAWLGIAEGVAETTASVFKLLSGWFSDRLGRRKPIVLVGYTLSTIGRPLMALATAGWHVVVVRFLDRIGKGVRGAPRDAIIAETCAPERLGKAFGLHRAMDNVGGVLGPLAASAILLLAPGEYRLVFWCAFIPGLLTLPLILAVREPRPVADAPRKAPPRLTLTPFDARFRYYLLVVLVFTLGNSSDMFLMARASHLGMAPALVPTYWLSLQLIKALLAMPGGMLADKVGKKPMLVAGWAVYALAYFGYGLADAQWQLWPLTLLYGVFYGLTEGGERAIVAELVPGEHKGTAYGVFSFTVGIGLLPANALMGWLLGASWAGPAVAFGASAALALVAALLLVPLARR